MKHSLLIIAGILTLSLFAVSCKKDLPKKSNAKVFNVQKFSQLLQTKIIESSPLKDPQGFSFIITQNQKIADSFSYGIAYTSSAGGLINWTTKQEINVASVTKTLTAVAAFQLMKKNSLSEGSNISKWLPKYMNAHAGIKKLEFKELLTHSSGITESGTDYINLRKVIGNAPTDPQKTQRQYSNVNFAIFRILIPFMIDSNIAKSKELQFLPKKDTASFERWLSATYINYMQQNVFTPAGLGTVNCIPSFNTAMAYSEPTGTGQAFAINGDWTESCGGGGFYMNVQEMSKWMVYLTYTNALLSNDQRKLMDSQMMGWDINDCKMTIAGQAYGKNGALRWDSNKNGIAPDLGDAGLQTLIMKFPNKVELALAINSLPGAYRSLSAMAASSYNAAWE